VVDLLPVALDRQIAREHRRIAQEERRTGPEAQETSRGRGTTIQVLPAIIGLAGRKIIGRDRLTRIARKITTLRAPEQVHALALGPTTNPIAVKRHHDRIRMQLENHNVVKRHAPERRITVRMFRIITMQVRRTVETIIPVVITILKGAEFRDPRPTGRIKASPIAVQTHPAGMRTQIIHRRQSHGHPDPRLRTPVRLRQKIGRALLTIGGRQRHLITDRLRLQKTVTRRPLQRPGKLRPLGLIELNLLLSESRGLHRRRKASLGRKPVLQAMGRSVPLAPSNLDPRRATMTETRTTRTTRIGRKTNPVRTLAINDSLTNCQAIFCIAGIPCQSGLSR
jgi:hypothetical protein